MADDRLQRAWMRRSCENGVMGDAASPKDPAPAPEVQSSDDTGPERIELKEGEDYYYDGPYMVFTAEYHLKRGTCCNSGCRHCPYKETSSNTIPSD